MAYAELADLKARAGRLAGAWDESTSPSDTDLRGFLDATAGEIDAAVAARGFPTPVSDVTAAKGLLNVNADMALLLALRATWPGGSGPTQVRELISDVEARVADYRKGLVDGTLMTLLLLAAQSGAEMEGGSADFWTTEGADYEYWSRLTSYWPRFWTTDPWGIPASMQPEFRRGERF